MDTSRCPQRIPIYINASQFHLRRARAHARTGNAVHMRMYTIPVRVRSQIDGILRRDWYEAGRKAEFIQRYRRFLRDCGRIRVGSIGQCGQCCGIASGPGCPSAILDARQECRLERIEAVRIVIVRESAVRRIIAAVRVVDGWLDDGISAAWRQILIGGYERIVDFWRAQ